MLFPCLEIGVAGVVIGQNLIRVVTLVTVYYAPVVGIGGLAVNHLIIHGESAGVGIVLKEIVAAGILEYACQETLTAHCIPVAALEFTAEHDWSVGYIFGKFCERQITLLDAAEYAVGLLLTAQQHAGKLYPLGLSQRSGLLVTQMGHKCYVNVLESLISAALER